MKYHLRCALALGVLLAALILPADAAGRVNLTPDNGYTADYGIELPFTPSPRTADYTFEVFRGENTSQPPLVRAQASQSGGGTRTLYLPLAFDLEHAERYTIRVTAQPDARRAGLDTGSNRTFLYTTQYCGGRHTEAQGGYLLGDGSAGNPYVIQNAKQLSHVREHPGSYFRQNADIDLSTWGNWTPIDADGINYDGCGHYVWNLTSTGHSSGNALFGNLTNSTLRRFGVNTFTCTGGEYDAGLIRAASNVTLDQCLAANGTTRANVCSGGLFATAVGVTVRDSFSSSCNIYAKTANAGGLSGNFTGSLARCYAINTVAGEDSLGGISGHGTYASSFQNVYWETGRGAGSAVQEWWSSDSPSSVIWNYNPPGTFAKPAAEMTVQSTYQGFAFANVTGPYNPAKPWVWEPNQNHPLLHIFYRPEELG